MKRIDVVYTGADDIQATWASSDDPRPHLTLGEQYKVICIEEHSWHTKVFLEGFPNLGFPSVVFDWGEDEDDKAR